ncbi:uncharacterized protein LOC143261656 [Megalopta genalis]|uniref:uncharacterized protein LOC143261656 n=1 Tax=Megalopta genalis TaxID=115081 RepID=UPI003FD632BF
MANGAPIQGQAVPECKPIFRVHAVFLIEGAAMSSRQVYLVREDLDRSVEAFKGYPYYCLDLPPCLMCRKGCAAARSVLQDGSGQGIPRGIKEVLLAAVIYYGHMRVHSAVVNRTVYLHFALNCRGFLEID